MASRNHDNGRPAGTPASDDERSAESGNRVTLESLGRVPGDATDLGGGNDNQAGRGKGLNGPANRTGRDRPPLRKLTQIRPPDHGPTADAFRQRYPMLAKLLYIGTWDDIRPRSQARLKVVCLGGMVTVTLECPTEGQRITLAGATWDDAFERLEAACSSGDGPWMELNWGTGKTKRQDLRKKELDKRRLLEDDSE